MNNSEKVKRFLESVESRYGKDTAVECKKRIDADVSGATDRLLQILDEVRISKQQTLVQRQFLGSACNS